MTSSLCGNCDHYQIECLVKHRTNDIIHPIENVIQVNRTAIQFELVTHTEGHWSPFKGLVLKDDHDSETNLKNRPLNIGIVEVSKHLISVNSFFIDSMILAITYDSNF